MATAGGYIAMTATVHSGGDVSWVDPTNIAGSPDDNVAQAVFESDDLSTDEHTFTHSITLPAGSVVSQIKATVRERVTAGAMTDITLTVKCNNADVIVQGIDGGLGTSLANDTFTETGATQRANATATNVNTGAGRIVFDGNNEADTLEVDSIYLEFTYTPPAGPPVGTLGLLGVGR